MGKKFKKKVNMNINENGYSVIKNVLTTSEIENFRVSLDNYFDTKKSLYVDNNSQGSKILPGWSGITPELSQLNFLHTDERITSIISDVFQKRDFRFLGHSDLHQNKVSPWHRDIVDMKRGGCDLNIWTKECFIIKVCFLLQDHIDNDSGLWFRPKTHKEEGSKTEAIHAYTKAVDMIVFDQRIWHKGQDTKPKYRAKYNQNRYLITFGYGLNNNPYSDFHEKGANTRQKRQRENMVLKDK